MRGIFQRSEITRLVLLEENLHKNSTLSIIENEWCFISSNTYLLTYLGAFYGTRKLITAVTNARQLSLS